MRRLFICEKSSQATAIATVLGGANKIGTNVFHTNGGTVAHARGHLLELVSPKEYDPKWDKWLLGSLPIIPSEYRMKPAYGTGELLKNFGPLLESHNEVVIATDAGIEGEMIAREILDHFNYKGAIKRFWTGSMDEENVRKALANLKDGEETIGLYYAAQARAQADWAIGMTASRAITCAFYPATAAKGFYSIGRVQTPTTYLVVLRDREIANFVARDFFDLVADVDVAGGGRIQLFYAPTNEDRIFERPKADALAAQARGTRGAISVKKADARQKPPKPFSLATLGRKCNNLFDWSLDKTLKIAQELYEAKLTTYPRVDCQYIPEEMEADIPAIVAHLRAGFFSALPSFTPKPTKDYFNTKKVGEHHAIIPTKLSAAKLTGDQAKCYQLIASHYLACLHPDATFKKTTVTMPAAGVLFKAVGSQPIDPGWKVVFQRGGPAGGAEDDEEGGVLPDLTDGAQGHMEEVEVKGGKTKPPPYYTEGTLALDMENIAKYVTDPVLKAKLESKSVENSDVEVEKAAPGIGTPATRASILEKIKEVEYVVLKGKKLISTPKGQAMIATLEKETPQLVNLGMSALWEIEQEKIMAGSETIGTFMDGIHREMTTLVGLCRNRNPSAAAKVATEGGGGSSGKDTGVVCPKSKKPVMEYEKLYRFPGYPEVPCWKSRWLRPITAQEYTDTFSAKDHRSPKPLSGFKKQDGTALSPAHLRFDPKAKDAKEQFKLDFVKSGPSLENGVRTPFACPKTGEYVMELSVPNQANPANPYKYFYFAGWPTVKFWSSIARRPMSAKDYSDIVSSPDLRSPDSFAGFLNKDGKPFEAHIKFNPEATDPKLMFTMDLPNASGPAKATTVMCPKTKKPVMDAGKWFTFPGWPEEKFWKQLAQRDITAAEYAAMLASKEKESPDFLEGFVSKASGNPFKAKLKFDPKSDKKISFVFEQRDAAPKS